MNTPKIEIPTASQVSAPEPKPIAKPVATIPAAGLAGLRSSKTVIKQKTEEAEIEQQQLASNFENKAFDLAQFEAVWNGIALRYKEANLINKFVMMDRPIELVGTVAHMKVENEVQVQHFNEQLRMEVLGILRESLQNYDIDIILDVTVQDQGEKRLLYTQSDKYDFLVQKHPLLGELKQKLGLDHEF